MKEITDLIIEGTSKSPQIDLNQITGNLIISGRSIPENASKVYEPVLHWVSEYILRARPTTNFRLDLEYFNTATSIWLSKIFKVLTLIKEPDYVLIAHLYLSVEDFDDIKEFDDFKDAFPFAGIDNGVIDSIGIKIYGKEDDGTIVKEALVFIEQKQIPNANK